MSLLMLTPLRLEARAVAAGAPSARVVRTGMGPRRAADVARRLVHEPVDADVAVAVLGLAGAVRSGIASGDVVVASEVRGPEGRVVGLPTAGLVAATLRRAGLVVHVGPVHSVPRIAGARTRRALRDAGALAVDMESAWLIEAGRNRMLAIVRVMVDTPEHPVVSPRTVITGMRALRVLRRAAGALEEWEQAEPVRSALSVEVS